MNTGEDLIEAVGLNADNVGDVRKCIKNGVDVDSVSWCKTYVVIS